MSSLLSRARLGRRQMRLLYFCVTNKRAKRFPGLLSAYQPRIHLVGYRLCQRGVEANRALVESKKLSQCQTSKHFTVQSHIMKQHGASLSRKQCDGGGKDAKRGRPSRYQTARTEATGRPRMPE